MRLSWNGDRDSMQLLAIIDTICHKVIVTDEIERRYLHDCEALRKKYPQCPPLLNSSKLYLLWKETSKVDDKRLSHELPHLNGESEIKDEDREFARLAKLTDATLVTNDDPLIGHGHRLGFKTMSVSDALQMALRTR